jgi:hypothetical protein
LCDTAEGEFVHEIDLVRFDEVLVLHPANVSQTTIERSQVQTTHFEVFNNDGESSGEEHELTLFRQKFEELFDNNGEFRTEKLVCFIHNEGLASAEIGDTFASKVENSAWCSNKDVYCL